MNTKQLLLLCLVAFSCSGEDSDASAVRATATPPLAGHLGSRLPADAVAYFLVPDFPEYIDGLERSVVGRIFSEPQVQDFLAELLPLVGAASALGPGVDGLEGQAGGINLGDVKSFELGCVVSDEDGISSTEIVLDFGMTADGASRLFDLLEAQDFAEADPASSAFNVFLGPFTGWAIRQENHALFGFGDFPLDSSAGGLLDRADVKAGYVAVHEKGVKAYGFLDGKKLVNYPFVQESLANFFGEEMDLSKLNFQKSELWPLVGIHLGSGWDDEGSSLTRIFYDLGGEGSMPTPSENDLASYVPHDADSFSLGPSLTQGALLHAIEALSQLRPGGPEIRLSALLGSAAESLRGGGSFSWSKHGQSGGGVTWVELIDPKPLRQLFKDTLPPLAKWLKEEDSSLTLSSKRIKVRERGPNGESIVRDGPQYYFFNSPTEALPQEAQMASGLLGDFQPAFGITEDDWLVWSLGGVAGVRTALRSGLSKPPKNAREKGEADVFFKEFKSGFGGATGLPPSWGGWSDPRPALRANIGIAKALAGLAGGAGDGGMGAIISKLPGPDPIVRHVKPSRAMVWRDGEGNAIYRSVGNLGAGDVVPIISTLAIGGMFFANERGKEREIFQGIAPGAPSPEESKDSDVAPSDSKRAQLERAAKSELARLQTGIFVYEVANGSLPSSLSDLIPPKGGSGFLPDMGAINSDPWGNDFVFRLTASGYEIFSMGPDGQEGGGDDLELPKLAD